MTRCTRPARYRASTRRTSWNSSSREGRAGSHSLPPRSTTPSSSGTTRRRAIRRIGEAFENDLERKALLVMATGAGKTRTVIALSDLLMRCNWAKRILFLADRIALVNQAVGAFKTHLPSSSPVNLVTERHGDGRVYVSTYPTMMGLIDEMQEGRRRFGPGHFDLIVIDEAHRSVYQKYRAIFDYFDSLLVGLTATPKDEIDINTYQLFDLERGVPTDAYPLDDAIKDGFLVPPIAVSVPIKFQRQGITYKDLSREEQEKWDALEWGDDDPIPDRVESSALNAWLFNEDTVDKVLAHLMTEGQRVAGGDRIGKTIIFAKNQAHADFIVERFDANYPKFKGAFARTIYHGVTVCPVTDRRLLELRPRRRTSLSPSTCSTPASISRMSLISSSSSRCAPRRSSGRWWAWDQAPSGPLRPRRRQEELLHPRLLRQPRILQLGPGNGRGSPRRDAQHQTLHDPPGPHRRAGPGQGVGCRRRRGLAAPIGDGITPARCGGVHEPRQLRRAPEASACRAVRQARGVDCPTAGRPPRACL